MKPWNRGSECKRSKASKDSKASNKTKSQIPNLNNITDVASENPLFIITGQCCLLLLVLLIVVVVVVARRDSASGTVKMKVHKWVKFPCAARRSVTVYIGWPMSDVARVAFPGSGWF